MRSVETVLATSVILNECRICGSIITSSKGVERHKRICRLSDIANNGNFEQIATVNFPSPIVSLNRILLSPEELSRLNRKEQVSTSAASSNPYPSQKSSLRKSKKVFYEESSDGTDSSSEENDPEFTDNDDGISDTDFKEKANSKGKNAKTSQVENDGKFACPMKGCGSSSTRSYRLKNHFLKHLKINPFKCRVPGCNAKLDCQQSLDRHIESRHSSGANKAPKQKVNIRDVIASDPVFQRVCKETPGFKDLILGDSKPKRKFICPVNECESKYNNVRQLRKHFVTHLENNPYACVVPGCNRQLDALWHLIEHLHWHLGKARYQCQKCDRRFADNKQLKNHTCNPKRSGFNVSRNNMSSEKVNEYLKSRFALLKSEGFYEPSRGESKKEKDEFGLIVIKHLDIKIRAIVESDPVFQNACKKYPHFRDMMLKKGTPGRKNGSGSNETYKCLKCSKTFSVKTSLESHVALMHSSRPFVCPQCKKCFQRSKGLQNHMKFHSSTGNTIYVKKLEDGRWGCIKCSFKSAYETSVNRHWRIMHNVTVPNSRITLLSGKEKSKTNAATVSKIKAVLEVSQESVEVDTKSDMNASLDISDVKIDTKALVVESVELDSFIMKSEPIYENMAISESENCHDVIAKEEDVPMKMKYEVFQ